MLMIARAPGAISSWDGDTPDSAAQTSDRVHGVTGYYSWYSGYSPWDSSYISSYSSSYNGEGNIRISSPCTDV